MIRLTKQADYGIVLLTRMAEDAGRLFTTAEMAEEVQLPQPTVSKVLKQLAREGLLESHRGVKGGYCLERPAEEISVAEIIIAFEGPIAVTECIDDSPGECSHEPICPVRAKWHLINQAIREALGSITLAEMTHPVPPRLVALGGGEPAEATELS